MKRSNPNPNSVSPKRRREEDPDMDDMAFNPPDLADLKREELAEETDRNEEVEPGDQDELVRQATDVVEGMVLRVAGKILNELHAPYDTSLYSDVFFAGTLRDVEELKMNLRLERNVVVPIYCSGRIYGTTKAPFVVRTSSGRALLALEVKTKRTALKDSDMDNLRCVVEQMGIQTSQQRGDPLGTAPNDKDRPRAMVVNFSAGTLTSMIMQRDGTVSN